MKETSFTLTGNPVPGGSSSGNGGGGASKFLIGAVVVLAALGGYDTYEITQLKSQLNETKEAVTTEVGKVNETHTTSNKETRADVAALKTELAAARARAEKLTGDARAEAEKKTSALENELEAKIEQTKKEGEAQTAKVAERVTQVDNSVTGLKADTNVKIGQVDANVSAVKAQAEANDAAIKKTIADLKSTNGDLGIQSGLIATNSKEINALRALGERNIIEFKIPKAKTGQRVGELTVKLTKTDPKKNKYTVEVLANDKLVEKKDKTANEPVQFIMPRYSAPFEFVVNDVQKDMIVGYLSYPKVKVASN